MSRDIFESKWDHCACPEEFAERNMHDMELWLDIIPESIKATLDPNRPGWVKITFDYKPGTDSYNRIQMFKDIEAIGRDLGMTFEQVMGYMRDRINERKASERQGSD